MVDASSSASGEKGRRIPSSGRSLRSPRRIAGLPNALPNARALVGSLLCVAAALLAWFAASGGADDDPRPVAFAARDIAAGAIITPDDVELRSVAFPAGLRSRTFAADVALIGAVTLGPVGIGDPVLRTSVLTGPATSAARQLSLTLPVAAAVGGTLRTGDTVDVLATFGGDRSSAPGETVTLARNVVVSRVSGSDPNVVSPTGDRLITFALDPLLDVESLVNASVAAKIHLVRTTGTPSASAAQLPIEPSGIKR